MKKILLFAWIMANPVLIFSQTNKTDTIASDKKIKPLQIQNLPDYKNGFTINCETFINYSLILTYSHRLKDNSYFEIGLSGRLSYTEGVYSDFQNFFFSTSVRDPYYLYNLISVRTGWKKYFYRHLYIEPIVKYGVGFYNHPDYIFNNDNLYFLHRTRNNLALYGKMGITYQYKHLLIDFYWGQGINVKYYYDKVYKRLIDDDQNGYITNNDPNKTYPYYWNHFGASFPVLLGLQLGYCF